jgi:hypothetical protein
MAFHMDSHIDLDKELRDLFRKEEMLAFFNFQFPNGANEPLTGFCNISRPRTDRKAAHYFSLLFVVDTSPAAGWEQIDHIFNKVPWEALKQRVAGVDAVLTLPYSRPVGELYIQEIDVYLQTGRVLSKVDIVSRLLPAVTQLCGCQPGDVVFCDDASRPPQPATITGSPENSEKDALPLMTRMRRWLGT